MRRSIACLLAAVLAGPVVAGAAEREHLRRADDLPFSDAVRVGDLVFLAGKLGLDPETGSVPDDPAAEARNVLDSMQATLAKLDLTMDDLVSVQIFCSDVSLYETFNGVYRTYFEDAFPARAFVGSGPLLRGARFEVQGIAHVPGTAAE